MDRRAPLPAVRDTSPEAARVQGDVLRAMSPGRKVELVEDANRTARQLALAGIRLRFPEASAADRNRILMDVVLGEELAARAFGPRKRPAGR